MEKKNNGILMAIIVILIVALLGVCFYVAYDKGLLFNNEVEENENINKEVVGEQEIDINSRLVQSLYNKVKKGFWGFTVPEENFYSDNKDNEETKMKIVGSNFSVHDEMYVTIGDCQSIPDNIEGTRGYSSCYLQKNNTGEHYNVTYDSSAYSKEYVEYLYKDIFGSTATLDTSVPIVKSPMSSYYHYVEEIQKYVLYYYNIGGGGAYGFTYDQTLKKAIRINDELRIYENVVYKSMDNTEEYTVVYTFKLDDDGMYSFYSRVKE